MFHTAPEFVFDRDYDKPIAPLAAPPPPLFPDTAAWVPGADGCPLQASERASQRAVVSRARSFLCVGCVAAFMLAPSG